MLRKFMTHTLCVSMLFAGNACVADPLSAVLVAYGTPQVIAPAVTALLGTLWLGNREAGYKKSHLPRSGGVALVEVDEAETFGMTPQALEYNAQETEKLMCKKYPKLTGTDVRYILGGEDKEEQQRRANQVFYMNGLLTEKQRKNGEQAIIYRHGLPVDNADERFFQGGAMTLKWARKAGLPIWRTQDWHPKNSKTFASTHNQPAMSTKIVPGMGVFRDGSKGLMNVEQILWNDHGIQNTWGAKFVNDPAWSIYAATPILRTFISQRNDRIKRKGQDNESYSGAIDTYRNPSGLIEDLDQHGVGAVIVKGLAGGHCVDNTAYDLAAKGDKKVAYLVDGTRWMSGFATVNAAYKMLLVNSLRKLNAVGVEFYCLPNVTSESGQSAFVNGLFKEAGVKIEGVGSLDVLRTKLATDLATERAEVPSFWKWFGDKYLGRNRSTK